MRRDDLVHAVRERLKRYPEPHASHYGVVPLPPPDAPIGLGDAAARYRAASEAMTRLDLLAGELKDPHVISRVLTRREALSSSAIEGTHSTLDELLLVEETADDEARGAVAQVRDYALALDQLLPRAGAVGPTMFTLELVQELHRAVVRGDSDYRDTPGALRDVVVWIGGPGNIAYSTYNPTPPEDVAACLADTLSYMQADGPHVIGQGLLTRMAVAHAHFEAVHPFRDGNGRVGRLLLPLMMAAEGHVPLYLSPYIDAHKADYYAALKAAQQRLDWPAIVGFLADAVVGTASELMATRRALSDLQRIWRERRRFRAGSAALRALDLLPHYPVLTVGRLAALLGLSYRAASLGIGQLVDAGILVERTGYRRNRVYAAVEALSLVNRPFGAEPILPGAET
ncbi:cell filamentation protein Fic [Allostella vacuolata]|nr:cell filamentation protein Fic [Stella vacuolata]